MPRAARSSRYASAVVSTFAFLVMDAPAVSLQPKSQHPPCVPFVDLRFFGGRRPHPLHRLDRVPDEPWTLLGVEGISVPNSTRSAPKNASPHSIACRAPKRAVSP